MVNVRGPYEALSNRCMDLPLLSWFFAPSLSHPKVRFLAVVEDRSSFWEIDVKVSDTVTYCSRLGRALLHTCIPLRQVVVSLFINLLLCSSKWDLQGRANAFPFNG